MESITASISEKLFERLAPKTREYYDEFSVCEACDQIYWKGTHYQRMRAFIEQVLAAEG